MSNSMPQSFDFDDIMASLQVFMRNSDEFKDVNWDGSAAKAMLRVLAYNTQLQQQSNNFLFNEMDIGSATIRENAAAIASATLGYLANGKRAAVYYADIIVTPKVGQSTPAKLTLDRSSKFFATKDGLALTFSADTEYETSYDPIAAVYIFKKVKLVQGSWVSNSFVVQTEHNIESYILPNSSIDTNYISVGVLPSSSSSDITNYDQFSSVYGLGPNSHIYFVTLDKKGRYHIEFGDDRLCRRLRYGEVVMVESLITDGSDGNNVSGITSVGSIGNFFDIEVAPMQLFSYGGSDEEDIDTIKKVAPLSFASQGSAVSDSDFVAVTKELYPAASSIISWGGEKNTPPRFGYQFVAVKPTGADTLTPAQAADLQSKIATRCVGSISPLVVNPEYTYIDIDSEVLYQSSKTILSEQSLKIKLTQALRAYSVSELEFFDADFVFYKFSNFINSVDKSFDGNVTLVDYKKVINPELNVSGNYSVNFNTQIRKGSVLIEGFTIQDDANSNGWAYSIVDVNGSLFIKKTNPDMASDSSLFAASIGVVDYATGAVKLFKFKPNAVTKMTVKVRPDSTDPSLFTSRSEVLVLGDLNINVSSKSSIRS